MAFFARMDFLRSLLLLGLLALASTPASKAFSPSRIYKGVIVMDAGSGRVLFADRADEESPRPA